MLKHMGVSESQASAIMDLAIPMFIEEAPGYQVTWDQPAWEYPSAFYAAGFQVVKRAALQWIDANLPQAWFRAMFV
mgnify:CR=1 FL=1